MLTGWTATGPAASLLTLTMHVSDLYVLYNPLTQSTRTPIDLGRYSDQELERLARFTARRQTRFTYWQILQAFLTRGKEMAPTIATKGLHITPHYDHTQTELPL